MPTEDQMSVNERRKYVKLMKARYVAAKRGERSRLLTEMEQVTGVHRKSLTRLMHAVSLERKKPTTPRARTYGLELERVLVRVWESRDYFCAERLTPGLLTMAQHLARFEPLGLTSQVQEQSSFDQPSHGGTPPAQASFAGAALATERSRASQCRHPRGADGTHSLGGERTGTLRGGPGLSQWREYGRTAWTHHPTDRCSHWLE